MVSPSRVRISIRYKLLAVITALLLVALGAYVYLATTLFNRDKLAYVFDANAALVESLADQTQANLTALTQILTLFGRDVAAARDPASASLRSRADETFVVEPDLVRIEVYRRDRQGALVRFGAWDHPGQLEALGLSARDLEAQERQGRQHAHLHHIRHRRLGVARLRHLHRQLAAHRQLLGRRRRDRARAPPRAEVPLSAMI